MHYVVCKVDPGNHAKVLREPVESEDRAYERAAALLASHEAFACVIEDDNGIVADDAEVAKRCASL
jgi:hypothetical protein